MSTELLSLEFSPTCLSVVVSNKPMVLDSGATHHMVNNYQLLSHAKPLTLSVTTGNSKNSLTATAIGTAVLVNHAGKKLTLHNVLFIPNLSRNLLSLTKLIRHNFHLLKKDSQHAMINIDNCFTFNSTIVHNLLELSDSTYIEMNPASSYLSKVQSLDWHS